MEQTAAQAERASIKYKQVEFMSERLGQIFQGTISGVTEFGIYVLESFPYVVGCSLLGGRGLAH